VGFTADRSAESLVPTDDELDMLALRVVQEVGERLRELVAEFTPVSDDPFRQFPGRLPGTLKRSWRVGEIDVRGRRYSVTVDTDDPVAPHVEWDTAPHRIRPRPERQAAAAAKGRRAMLSWRDEFGRQVFAHEVLHPGTSGAHMMARALERLELEWPVIARREMARLGL
jgi:hypothetical protein